jgi:hypothetical protein
MPLASHMNCRSIASVVLINTRTFDALRSPSKRRDFHSMCYRIRFDEALATAAEMIAMREDESRPL